MKTLPPNKTAEELGFKVGDRFVLEKPDSMDDADGYKKGDIFTLKTRTQSTDPSFFDGNGKRCIMTLSQLSPLKEDETMDMKYKAGDILVGQNGDKRKVLGVCGLVYFLSDYNYFEFAAYTYTQHQLDNGGFKLYTEDDTDLTEVTAEESKKTLYRRILDITEEIGAIEKDGSGEGLKYKFIEQSLIKGKLRPLLAKHGVAVMPEVVSKSIETKDYTDQYGKAKSQRAASVEMRFTLVNVDDPTEMMTLHWDGGEALDTSDKATPKAITAAHKSFLIAQFNISEKEDPDAVRPEIERGISIEQSLQNATTLEEVGKVLSSIPAKLQKEYAPMVRARADEIKKDAVK